MSLPPQNDTQPSAAQEDDENMIGIQPDAASHSPETLWRPSWLDRTVFAAFITCFVALLAGLETIFQISRKKDGLASASRNWSYAWTYGPTAILTLVLALWNRVDFRIRQMAPWMSMSQGMMTSNIGALLKDYVAPTSPEILWHSLKNHDFAVAASTAITILITLLIVVSTGLLTLEVHPMRHEQVSYRTRSSFMSDEADTLPLIKSSLPVDILDAIDAISLPYPIGTTPKSVFQLFEPVNHHFSRDVLQEAVVDVVTFDLDCESAQIHVTNWIYSWPQCFDELTDSETPEEYIDMSISTDDCTISPLLEYSYGEAGASGIFAFFDTTSCSDESASTQIFAWLLV